MIRPIHILAVCLFLLGLATPVSAAPRAEDIVYVVQPGDTLTGVASQYGVTVEAIARINKISDVNQIHSGLKLIIPNPEDVLTSNENKSVSIKSGGIVASTADVFPPISSIPVITPHMREVYITSTHRGKKLNMFTAVGDCNLAPSMRIWRLAERNINISQNPALQSAADFFSPSFYRPILLASNPGFTSSSLNNPNWANPAYCRKGETPLVCDLRDSQASIVFINIGTNDLYYWFDFENNYRKIIVATLQEGSLPVLVTKADDIEENRAGSGYINNVIRRLGKEYDLPVFDYWSATRQLPNNGLVENEPHHYTEEAFDMRLLGFLYTVSAIVQP